VCSYHIENLGRPNELPAVTSKVIEYDNGIITVD